MPNQRVLLQEWTYPGVGKHNPRPPGGNATLSFDNAVPAQAAFCGRIALCPQCLLKSLIAPIHPDFPERLIESNRTCAYLIP